MERSDTNGVNFERLYHVPKGNCPLAMVEKEEGKLYIKAVCNCFDSILLSLSKKHKINQNGHS